MISSGAQEELRALQELAHLPVATSTMGKGSVDETHPLSMGVIGYFMATRGMAKFVKPMVTDADVVLLIGNRTNQNGTDSWKLLPREATYIHIDIDPMEIGRNYEAMRLNGDAKLTLRALNSAMVCTGSDQTTVSACSDREVRLHRRRARHREEIAGVTQSDAAPIRPERFMAELEKQLSGIISLWRTRASRRSGWPIISPPNSIDASSHHEVRLASGGDFPWRWVRG